MTIERRCRWLWQIWMFRHWLWLKLTHDENRVIKIGLSMGTFNPLHLWHVQIAVCARVSCGLDFVLIIPNGDPPHKQATVSKFRRYKWVRGAARGKQTFHACPIETYRSGKSYTVDTLKQLHALYESWGYTVELHLIVGMDNLESIQSWHLAPEMLRLCKLAIASRNSRLMTKEMVASVLPGLPEGEYWQMIDCPDSDVSSTIIRTWYASPTKAECADYVVPNAVRKDIRRNNPYLTHT